VKLRLLIVVTTGSFLAASAAAQPDLERGTRELSVHVSPDWEGAVGDMIYAKAGYGWFWRQGLLARGTLDYAVLEDIAGEDEDYRTSELGVAGEYHFNRASRFVPYLGIGLGWRSSHFGGAEEAALVYGPRGGIKFFIVDNVALDFEVTYKLGGADVFINDFVAEDTDASSAIGLRVLF